MHTCSHLRTCTPAHTHKQHPLTHVIEVVGDDDGVAQQLHDVGHQRQALSALRLDHLCDVSAPCELVHDEQFLANEKVAV